MAIFSDPILLLAAVVGLIFVVTVIANPFAGVLALFGLGMVSDLQHFGHFASFSKLLVLLIGIGFLGRLVVDKRPLRTQVVLPLGLFVVVYCAGASRGVEGSSGWLDLLTFLGYVVGFFLVLNIVKTKREIKWIFVVVAAGATFDSVELIAQWFQVPTPLSILQRAGLPMAAYQVSAHVERTLGFARDPNAAAYPCILAAPVLLALALSQKRLPGRFLTLAVFGLTIAGLATTQSRSGELGFAVGASVFLLLTAKRAYKTLPMLLLVVGLLLAFLPYRDFSTRWHQTGKTLDKDRLVQYEIGLSLFEHEPLLGGGKKAFIYEMDLQTGDYHEPHSNLLSIAVSSGLLGLAALLCLLISYISTFSHHWVRLRDPELKVYAAGALSAILGLQAQGFFIGNMGWFLMWAMAALCICSLLAEQKETVTVVTRHPAKRLERRAGWQSEASAS